MTSTSTSVFFSTRANLYCHISFLSIKHANAPKSRSVWASIVTSVLHLIMISTKKHGVRPKDRLRPFSLHDASRLSFIVPIETGHVHFLIPLVVDSQQRWHVWHVVHASLDIHEQHDLILHNTNKDYLYIDIIFLT
jgi:hypothetical protein